MAKGNLELFLGEARQWEDINRGGNFIGIGAPLFKFGWRRVLYIVIQSFMRPSGVYLVEVELGTWRSTAIPQGDLQITLRIGRNSTFLNYAQPHSSSSVNFNSTLQLNVDSMALETQRCSITLNTATADKKVLGIALVSLPKDKNTIQNTYKLTQSEDKKAEIDIKIRIAPLEPYSNPQKSTIAPQDSQNPSVSKESSMEEQEAKAGNNTNKIYTGSTYKIDGASNASSIRLKSRNSDAASQGGDTESRTNLKTYKIREVDRMIQISESELKRFKDEKEAYYQMYQIEKSKNQMASKFISSVIKKLAEKYPGLVSSISDISTGTPPVSKRMGDAQTEKNRSTKSTITQDPAALEQANRSLHRQIDEYKRIVDQLKNQLSKGGQAQPSKIDNGINLNPFRSNINLLPPNILNDFGPSPPSRFNSNIKSVISTPPPPPPTPTPSVPAPKICEVDLKKWLQLSVGQRSQIQSTFSALPLNTKQQANEKQPNLRKTKMNIDRAFATLLSKKDLTKQVLLSHKQQINRIFDQIASY